MDSIQPLYAVAHSGVPRIVWGEVTMKDFASFGNDFTEDAEALVGKFAGKSEQELVREIYARAVEGKRAGTLTDEQIDAFYARFSPMLDGGKRKRLKKLVEELKRM